MRITIPLLLLLALLGAMLMFAVSCGKDPEGEGDTPVSDVPGDTDPVDKPEKEDTGTIIMPIYKDYPDRDTVAFSEIAYARPDVPAAIAAFEACSALIREGDASYEEQLSAIEELEDAHTNVLTMRSLATIKFYQDSENTAYQAEYTYVNETYPDFLQSVEELFVSAANSSYAERFETDYFGAGLIEGYKDGGVYTDEVVTLMEEEASLESEYEALSPETVTINYNGTEDTAQNHLDRVSASYAENSKQYLFATYMINSAYQTAYYELASEIYVELLKTRALIAKEMGAESYRDIAYKNLGYEYTDADIKALIENIKDTVVPIYTDEDLYAEYAQYQQTSSYASLQRHELINHLYTLYAGKSERIADIYAYMLQFSLYDVDAKATERYEGAFTTYLEGYDAPFLFVSTDGKSSDYTTLAHEFGHFTDMYTSYGGTSLLHLSETFSESMELLTLLSLEGVLSTEEYAFLKFNTLYSFLQMLTVQGFYAEFEREAYALTYEQITREALDALVKKCATEFGFSHIETLDYVIIPHTMLYPFYVQSYCLSAVPALEIYFTEFDAEGEGFAIYERLLDAVADESAPDFTDLLLGVGLSDPYDEETLSKIADRIYYDCMGKNPPCEEYPPGNAA